MARDLALDPAVIADFWQCFIFVKPVGTTLPKKRAPMPIYTSLQQDNAVNDVNDCACSDVTRTLRATSRCAVLNQ